MTPVEERIDHEEAKGIAKDVTERASRLDGYSPDERIYKLARAYSAREADVRLVAEWTKRQIAVVRQPSALSGAVDRLLASLPAAEPAQPEEERNV